MRLNLKLAERRVLLFLKREGPKDADDIADLLPLSSGEVKEAIGMLSEKDLVVTDDRTTA